MFVLAMNAYDVTLRLGNLYSQANPKPERVRADCSELKGYKLNARQAAAGRLHTQLTICCACYVCCAHVQVYVYEFVNRGGSANDGWKLLSRPTLKVPCSRLLAEAGREEVEEEVDPEDVEVQGAEEAVAAAAEDFSKIPMDALPEGEAEFAAPGDFGEEAPAEEDEKMGAEEPLTVPEEEEQQAAQ